MTPSTAAPGADRAAKIRVMVADDHAVVRKGIRAVLDIIPEIEMVGEAENGRLAVEQARRLQPDVILMDLMMPEMDGIEAIRRIKADQPQARILVLTTFAGEDKVFAAIKAGALGYHLKDSGPDELVQGIRQVCRGESSLHPAIARKVLQELARAPDQPVPAQPLAGPEVEVLRLLAQGRSNQEIAEQLEMSEAAVRTEISGILGKLHTASRTQAVLYALQQGLASLDDAAPQYVHQLLETIGTSPAPAPAAAEEEPAGERELEALRLIAADYQEVGQELALAWEIQASFLPDRLPELPGWQLDATLEPARETSGDFYDVIPLPNGRLGILVADVSGKGMGAALFMALSRTLIRTYALQYDTQPERVLSAANRRILADTNTSLFVTVFYGILDPEGGALTYSNAGHNPAFVLNPRRRDSIQQLFSTGIPLGMLGDVTWEQAQVQLNPDDVFVLYSDGVTEAQDRQEAFFGAERLLRIVQANLDGSAETIRAAIIGAVRDFTREAPHARMDDITLMVVRRSAL